MVSPLINRGGILYIASSDKFFLSPAKADTTAVTGATAERKSLRFII
jgi:hypothetical protein